MANIEAGAYPFPPADVLRALQAGLVIPAHPLALTAQRKLDERRQQALTRYYLDAGAGGLAVGVHTTQFEIHDPLVGLYLPVLRLATQTIAAWEERNARRIVRIAGICGETPQAVTEARQAADLGFHAGLLSLSALRGQPPAALLAHARAAAREIPLIGFYLQPAVGGMYLPYSFWQAFAEIPNVVAIKIAPFNRYQTLDVVRAVAQSGRADQIALYTGNDDNIVIDLLSPIHAQADGALQPTRIVGGLLGHWACWTRRAVELFRRIQETREQLALSPEWLTLAWKVTDCNAAFFDAANGFAGVLCGVHEVLRRQGLLENNYCLNESERLSPGQAEEIDRVYRQYPELNDDDFVRENLARWLDG